MQDNIIASFKACSPPSCSCPEVELYQDIDDNYMVSITDDYNGVAIMSLAEFKIVVEKAEGLIGEAL